MPYSAAVFTRKKIDHLVDINNMTLRVGKELYKKLNIIFISIFIINKYNPSLSAINFLPQYIIMNILRFSYVGGWGRNGEIETRYWTSHLRFAMLCKSTILQ